MSDEVSGFAIRRNGDCVSSERDCGETEKPFRACCPRSSFCKKDVDNWECCPTSDECASELDDDPRCALPIWDLFDNNGYFCCKPGHTGYNATKTNSNGCAAPGYKFGEAEETLPLVREGEDPTASSSSTPTAEPPADDDGGAPVGAIAGGTVGGVAALAIAAAVVWWFCVRKRRRRTISPKPPPAESLPKAKAPTPPPGELDGEPAGARSEANQLPDQHGVSELPG